MNKISDLLKNEKVKNALFIGILIILFFVFGQYKYLTYRPQGIHIWRQADCLAITQSYYQNSNSFWKPEIYNQFSDDGLSRISVGEFPILYYVVAQSWKLFGKHEWIYRAFVFLIFSLGSLAFFVTISRLTKNLFLSIFLALLLYTSPTVLFYSIGFLTNIPALAFVFMAWFFFLKFAQSRKDSFLWISMALFSMAMLLKVSSGLSFVALGGWWFIETVFIRKDNTIFNKGIKHLIPFVVALIPVILWYLYARHLNDIHRGQYTFNGIWPIWEMTKEKLAKTFDVVDKIWLKEYFHPSLLIITGILWVFLLAIPRKIKAFYYYLLLVIPLGSIIYLLLWFQALEGHDYYLIDIFIMVPIIWGVFFIHFRDNKWLNSRISYAVLFMYLLFLGIKVNDRFEQRFDGWMNEWYVTNLKEVGELEPVLDSLNIGLEERVISIPDVSINATLYFLNRKGWTNYGSNFADTNIIEKRISQGAKYIVINDSTAFADYPVQKYLDQKIYQGKHTYIYSLKDN